MNYRIYPFWEGKRKGEGREDGREAIKCFCPESGFTTLYCVISPSLLVFPILQKEKWKWSAIEWKLNALTFLQALLSECTIQDSSHRKMSFLDFVLSHLFYSSSLSSHIAVSIWYLMIVYLFCSIHSKKVKRILELSLQSISLLKFVYAWYRSQYLSSSYQRSRLINNIF